MSIVVKTSWYEQFLNHIPKTKLYIRGQSGKNWETQRQMEKDLIEQLRPLFEKWKKEEWDNGYSIGFTEGYKEGLEHSLED